MNFHALVSMIYKRAVVSEFVCRIFRACSSWQLVDESSCSKGFTVPSTQKDHLSAETLY